MFKPDTAGLRFGPFWFTPGLTRLNVATAIFASFTTIAMVVYMSLIQPYVLNEVVQIPQHRQGTLTGYLTLLQEGIVVLLVGLMGAWSDRAGRRFVFVVGLSLLGVGYLVFPLATAEWQLYAYRIVFAVGVATAPVMVSATVQDLPQEISRGKWVGINNFFQGLGILLIATMLLTRAPKFFLDLGADPVAAGRYAFWSATAICLVVAVVLRAGLPHSTGAYDPGSQVHRQFTAALRAGLSNPRLALAFGSAIIGRGDLVVVGSFFTLWVTQYALEQGMSTAEGVAKAGMLFGIIQVSALLWAFFMGLIADRINRVTSLIVALGFATVGYSLMGQVEDPFGPALIPIAILLGIGEVSVIVGGGALLGQEARVELRGAIIGLFNLLGGIGIMAAATAGGIIFDSIARNAPFTMMGIMNGLLLLCAVLVRVRAGTPSGTRATEPA